jgi:hypothetical protein
LGIKKLLGEILTDLSYCSQKDIHKALEIQEEFGGRIGTILINTGILKEENVLKALSLQFGYPLLEENSFDDFGSVELENINISFFKEHHILPLKLEGKQLTLILSDPLKITNLFFLKQEGYTLNIQLATSEWIREKLELIFENSDHTDAGIYEVELDKLRELASEAPVIKLLNTIFLEAVEKKTEYGDYEGIVVDEKVAKESPCYQIDDTDLVFSKGIIGALNDEQKKKYCPVIIKKSPKGDNKVCVSVPNLEELEKILKEKLELLKKENEIR